MIDQQETTEQIFVIQGVRCVVAAAATRILSRQSGREVDTKYLNNPVRRGQLHPIKQDGINYYPVDELYQIVVRDTRGRRPEIGLSPEAKKAISEGQRRRWSRVKGESSPGSEE